LRHGLTVEQYQENFGLGLRVLESADRRAQRSASTYERMENEPKLRALLDRTVAETRTGAFITTGAPPAPGSLVSFVTCI
jgi:hypothetical protein